MTATVWGDGTPNEAVEIPPADIINEQSGNYVITESDSGKIIDYIGTGGDTFTFPATVDVGNGFWFFIRHTGSGVLTCNPVGADTISGVASITMLAAQTLQFIVKSADFGLLLARSAGVDAASVTNTPAGNIQATTVQAALNELDAEKAAIGGNAAVQFKVANATANDQALAYGQAASLFLSSQALIFQTHTAFTTAGTSTAYTLTPTLVQASYVAGQRFRVKFHTASGAAPTINISGLGALNLKQYTSLGAKVAGITATGMLADVEYDGTDVVILNRLIGAATEAVYGTTGTFTGVVIAGSLTLTNDLTVADGGTGRSTSTTAYGLIAAGTTATAAHQTLAAGATTEVLVGGGASALPVWTTATGTGAPVRATSPALVTPALGTPASGVLTNCTASFAGAVSGTTGAFSGAVSGTTITGSAAGMPKFSATSAAAAQSITTGVATKVSLSVEVFDTNNNFDPTTNYRFTPTVAGYYQINWTVVCTANGTSVTDAVSYLYKNGVSHTVGEEYIGPAVTVISSTGAVIVQMNGTTDYLELYGKIVGTNPSFYSGNTNRLNGALLV